VGTVIAAVMGVVGGVFGLITILILAFYLLLESDAIVSTFVRMFPRSERTRVEDASLRVATRLARGWAGSCCSAPSSAPPRQSDCFSGCAVLLRARTHCRRRRADPDRRPILSAVPAVAVGFTVSPTMALGVAAFYFAQQQLENHVLVRDHVAPGRLSASFVIIALLIVGRCSESWARSSPSRRRHSSGPLEEAVPDAASSD
jgi:hypothetical protein